MMPKIILVTGATGNQGRLSSFPRFPQLNICLTFCAGGSVAKLLLQHKDEYRVRALTRNPGSDAAKTLAELGAEVVEGDLTDASTLDPAFKDCWGAFVVTNFYDAVSVCHRGYLPVLAKHQIPDSTDQACVREENQE